MVTPERKQGPQTSILFLLGNALYVRSVARAVTEVKAEQGDAFEARYHVTREATAASRLDYAQIEKDIRRANIVLLDMCKDQTLVSLVEKYKQGKTTLGLSTAGDVMARITNMGNFSAAAVNAEKQAGGLKRIKSIFSADTLVYGAEGLKEKRRWLDLPSRLLPFGGSKHAQNYVSVYRYWQFGDKENLGQMMRFLGREYGGLDVKVSAPKILPTYAVYHPGAPRVFTNADDYHKWYHRGNGHADKPVIGILFYMKHYVTGNVGYLDEMIAKLEAAGAAVLPVMSEGTNNMAAVNKYFLKRGRPLVDVLISLPIFRLAGGPSGGDYPRAIADLERLGVPILKPVTMTSAPIKDWADSASGISPIYTALGVSLPEMDGAIEPLLLAGFTADGENGDIGGLASIPGRPDKVVRRTLAWARLRRKENARKKVAFVLYNYPPGKASVGSAAYLDVFSSLVNILDRMKAEGYDVGVYPRTGRDFQRLLTQRNLVNVDKMSWTNVERAGRNAFTVDAAQYQDWFEELPEAPRAEMVRDWGEAPGEVMRAGNRLLVPGITCGNVFVGFQPARGWGEDPAKMYHDRNIAPHHQYLAFYRWLERVFEADALVHFGTHGTLEFLPGKQIGLSQNCFPDIILPEVPNLYIYIVTGTSEGTIAKRRALATLINYNTPPMTASGAFTAYAALEDDITAYFDLLVANSGRADLARTQVISRAKECKLIDEEAEDTDIDALYDDIMTMKAALIPRGLHVMGRALTEADVTDYLLATLRFERGDLLPLQKTLCLTRGLNWDEAQKQPSARTDDGKSYGEILTAVDAAAADLIREVVVKGRTLRGALKKVGLKLPGERQQELARTLAYGVQVAADLRLGVSAEIDAVLKGLHGEYLPPGLGGDPVRSPDILPTGRNMVSFDPRKVPTKLAAERASQFTRQILDSYYAEHGEYPESVGTVLFSLEVMQTHGETVSEIFELIGVRPIRSGIGYIDPRRIEVIPLAELGRPRIDVAIDLSGIFRDTFPDVLQLIGKAVKTVAELDEPPAQNYIRKHSLEIERNLIAAGQGPAEASEFSKMRTFGVGAGIYGTNISKMIASAAWEDEKDIAEMYLDKQSHFYGETVYGQKNPEALHEILKHVSVCAQVRSTSLYGVSDLDHYYEHLGGITSSVAHLTQKKPVVMVADSSSQKVTTRRLGKQLEIEARTRFLDGKWINGMLDSGAHGMSVMADRAEHLVGWAATTSEVDTRVFKEMAGKYVFDDATRKRIIEENPWSLNDIIKILMEAFQRDYWQATSEELERMKQIYLELEEEIEEREV